MHARLDFVTKLQKYTSFTHRRSTSEDYNKGDAAVAGGDKMSGNSNTLQ